jgi:uncharacterized membrane protein
MAVVEYPPLAIAFLDVVRASSGVAVERTGLRPSDVPAYARGFRTWVFAFELLGLVVWLLALRRLLPDEGPIEHALRLVPWALGGVLLAHLLYDRLDAVLATPLVAAVLVGALVNGPGKRLASAALLGLGVAFKLIPLVALPALARRAGPRPALARLALEASAYGATALGVAVLLTAPAVIARGEAALGFLGYHAARPLQIESTWANLALLADRLGLAEAPVLWSHGSFGVGGGLASALASLSPIFVLVAVLVSVSPLGRPARIAPRTVAGASFVALLWAVAASKVLSPQYLLFLLPLVGLAPGDRRTRLVIAGLFLVACAASAGLFPDRYMLDVVGAGPPIGGRPTLSGPSRFGLAVLSLRNLALVACAVVASRALAREVGDATPSPA